MAITLPPSLVADPTAEKLEPYRHMSPEERLVITAAVCRSAAALLALHPDPHRVLDLQTPLPASSVAALERLRRD